VRLDRAGTELDDTGVLRSAQNDEQFSTSTSQCFIGAELRGVVSTTMRVSLAKSIFWPWAIQR
jgi:hypothetical protein